MPVYQFEYDDGANPVKVTDQRFTPKDRDGEPIVRTLISPIPQPPVAKREDILFENQNVNTSFDINEFLPQGYRTMDRGIKNYFSGIPVPTKDGYRIMEVRISGGDKPYLIWAQDLVRGRVQLPIMSIKREGDEHYPPKFSPAHTHYMSKRFVDTEGTKVALAYRPISSLINYSLSVWAEHKRDLEFIHYQIRTRFNPVAEFMVEDEHLRGSVFLKYNGMTVAVDDELPADQRANKRYEYAISMEGWMPLPEKIVSTILGRVFTLREQANPEYGIGEVLDTVQGKSELSSVQIRR
jgi:hypothetical protein